jgi:hypothetical protein
MSQNSQDVTVTPLAGGPGHNWEVAHNGHQGNDPATYPHVQIPAKAGAYMVHFTINGNNNIKFAAADPIWVQAGSKPTAPTLDSQITAVVTTTNGKDLFILDQNTGKPTELYYRLNFTGHGPLDPIMDNGGSNLWGGLTTTTLVIGATVLAFVVGIAFQRLFFAKGR